MKKIIVSLFVLILLVPFCFSVAEEVDLSGMSFDELVSLRDQINLAIWNSQEWQEVTVPTGIYTIGKDIPAGHWSIRVASKNECVYLAYFDKLDDVGMGVGRGSYLVQREIASPGFSAFGEINLESADIEMQEGWFFKCTGFVIFSPYSGKPDLRFK